MPRTKLFGRDVENQITFVGLANAGKTTLLKRIKGGIQQDTPVTMDMDILPTMGMNIETLKIEDLEVMAVDLGGQPSLQTSLWEPFVSKSQGLVFVFDSVDQSKIKEAGDWLRRVIEWAPEDSSFLFLANKQDLDEAMSLENIIQLLGLEEIMAERPRTFAVYQCSALTGEGVKEPWKWLSDRFSTLMRRRG